MDFIYYLLIIQGIIFCNKQHSSVEALIGKLVRSAAPNEFSFIVSIGHRFYLGCGINHFCGGSLITKKHVLTAAHCIENLKYSDIQVSIGSNRAEYGRIEMLESMISYAEWAKSKNMSKDPLHDDDVAILTLRKKVKDSKIKFPTLSYIDDTQYYNKKVMTAGWGIYKSKRKEYETARYLQTVNLKVWDRKSCTEHIQKLRNDYFSTLPPQWLCTKSPKITILGSGDSGGPLLYNKNVIIAVNAATCPISKRIDNICVQSVYMSIQYVKNFIYNIIKEINN